MILPITAYGHPVLRQVAKDITPDFPELNTLISNMWETMYKASGMGLAAPQINQSIRLFVIDTAQVYENYDEEERAVFEGETGFKKIFINAKITSKSGKTWSCDEGCLSLPGFREDVSRENIIEIEYLDENFIAHKETYKGLNGRVIQHEYDHIEGILFTDRINPLRKQLLKGKLRDIQKGNIYTDYRMKFYKG
jgi:peptide deformylase